MGRKKKNKKNSRKINRAERKSKQLRFALMDSATQTWLGDAAGNLYTFDDVNLAHMAARVWEVRMNWPVQRIHVTSMPDCPVLKGDELKPVVDAEEALASLEKGRRIYAPSDPGGGDH